MEWVPSHCGAPAKEKADGLSIEEGRKYAKADNEFSYIDNTREIQAIRGAECPENDDYHSLHPKGQTFFAP